MAAPHHPAQLRGYHDAQAGRTANPYGLPEAANQWDNGYSLAEDAGEALLPRFSRLRGTRR